MLLGAFSMETTRGQSPSQRAERHFRQAVNFWQRELYFEAETEFRQAAAIVPKHGATQHGIAMCLYHTDRLASALPFFKKAEASPRPEAQFFTNHAVTLEQLSRVDEAWPLLKKAVEIDPKYANAWLNLGKFRFRRGERAKARVALEKAVAIDPKFVEALYRLGHLEYREGRLSEAEKLAKRARSYNRRHYASLNLLGQVYRRMKRPKIARKLLLEADVLRRAETKRKIQATKSNTILDLAFKALRVGKVDTAIAHLEDVVTNDPTNSQARHTLGNIAKSLRGQGHAQRAVAIEKLLLQ